MFFYVVSFDHVDKFVFHFDYFIRKIFCLSVRGETINYFNAMCDISLERTFIYLLYGISNVPIAETE